MENTVVKFYDTVEDSRIKFAVIVSRSNGKWVFCKHKERDTYEAPGGHSEIERIDLMEDLPSRWTYPLIQPRLIDELKRRSIT